MNILIIFSLIISHIHHLIGMGKWLRSDEQQQKLGSDEESFDPKRIEEKQNRYCLYLSYRFVWAQQQQQQKMCVCKHIRPLIPIAARIIGR